MSWRWVLWMLSIAAFLVTVAGYLLIPRPVERPFKSGQKYMDWIGATLVTIALFSLLCAVTESDAFGWGQPSILSLSVFAGVYLEKGTTRQPLIRMSIMSNFRIFAAMSTTWYVNSATSLIKPRTDKSSCDSLISFVLFNFLTIATYLWQSYQGKSALETAMMFLPGGPAGSKYCNFIIPQSCADHGVQSSRPS